MKHLHIAKDGYDSDSGDAQALSLWLGEHGIDAMWLLLDQTIDIVRGHLHYREYGHTKKGVILHEKGSLKDVVSSTVPRVDTIHHRCTADCRDVPLPTLTHFKIEDDDEREQSPDSN